MCILWKFWAKLQLCDGHSRWRTAVWSAMTPICWELWEIYTRWRVTPSTSWSEVYNFTVLCSVRYRITYFTWWNGVICLRERYRIIKTAIKCRWKKLFKHMLMCSPGNFQDLREHIAANSFNAQYTSIFEKIPVSDQGRAMRGLDDWGCSCGSVVEHCVSSAKVLGSIPREHILTKKLYNLNVL